MNSELRKWRERNESAIRRSMRNPDDLDSIQNGTKGMPSIVRRRTITLPNIEENTVFKFILTNFFKREYLSKQIRNLNLCIVKNF